MRAFISYSHRDSSALGRLHTHLSVLRREGHIEEWFDREILAGGQIDSEIQAKLESFELFLLLLSPDFLASDYCVEKEMSRALERHHSGDARVIPIVVEPCDWASTALKELKVLPDDGKPISEWTNENNAYLDIVNELRRVINAQEVAPSPSTSESGRRKEGFAPGVRRYRIKRSFDEIDRCDFREQAFATMSNYFERAIAEIDSMEDLRGRFTSLSNSSFTCTIINRAHERGTAHITVHRRSEITVLGDIFYSFAESSAPNTANGIFSGRG